MSDDDWRTLQVAGLEIEVPPDVVPSSEVPIDGEAVVLEGPGIRVTLDRSPFADPLTGHNARPEFRQREERIGDRPAVVVSFRADGATRVVAARLPGLLTAVVRVAPGVDEEIALRMLRSIRPTDVEA